MTIAEPIACCAPLAAPELTAEEAEATAALFRAMGDPARVRILNLLATTHREVCGCELSTLGLAQPTISHHLKTLHEAGLIGREQRGRWAFYSLNRDAARKLALVADLKGCC